MTALAAPPDRTEPAVDARRRAVVRVGVLDVAWMAVGTVVAVGMGWPAQFGGAGDPERVAQEYLTRGTALSAPLGTMLVLALAVGLASRRGRTGAVGTVLMCLLSLLFLVGGLGEAFAPATADVPRTVLVLSGASGVVFALAVLVTGARRLRAR